jgi:hypothetical protein
LLGQQALELANELERISCLFDYAHRTTALGQPLYFATLAARM